MGLIDGLIGWVMSWFVTSEKPQVKAVRETTVAMCGFLPTVETVLALIAVSNPAVSATAAPAVLIARKICAAVTSSKQSLIGLDAPIIVDGVVIQGEFVTKEGE